MMGFREFLKTLLVPSLENSIIVKGIKEILNHTFDSILLESKAVLDQFFPQFENKEFWAKERGVFRFQNESEEQFFIRIKNAYAFSEKSARSEGMKEILQSLIAKKFKIRELCKERLVLGVHKLGINSIIGQKDMNFYFVVDFEEALTVAEKLYLEEIIEYYKPAHVGFHINSWILDEWIIGKNKLGLDTYI